MRALTILELTYTCNQQQQAFDQAADPTLPRIGATGHLKPNDAQDAPGRPYQTGVLHLEGIVTLRGLFRGSKTDFLHIKETLPSLSGQEGSDAVLSDLCQNASNVLTGLNPQV